MVDRGLGPGEQLPGGRHGLTAEEVAMHQRERIVDGIAVTVARYGFGGLTVEKVIGSAGVSRSTFYTHFRDKDEAVRAAHQTIFERFYAALTDTCDQSEWPVRIRNATGAALEFAIHRPEQFQVLFPGPPAGDLAARISAAYDSLAKLLGGVRSESPHGSKLPTCTEFFLIAGCASVVSSRLSGGSVEDRRTFQQQLVELMLIPYYGHGTAARLSRLDG
jgi:AcrR family transcriptional regulator